MGCRNAAGVDGITVAEFKDHLKRHWPTIQAKLLAGSYLASPVRRVDIAKPQGGVRTLGIPTLTDRRLIQQALHQVLSAIFETGFLDSSYGFRPGRSAHQGIKATGAACHGEPDSVPGATTEAHGHCDQERGRTAVAAQVPGLQPDVARHAEVADCAEQPKIRGVLKGARGRSVGRAIEALDPVLRGWAAYFKLTETKPGLEELGGWTRRTLRCILWRQWKRLYTRATHLSKAGLGAERAWRSASNGRGPW